MVFRSEIFNESYAENNVALALDQFESARRDFTF